MPRRHQGPFDYQSDVGRPTTPADKWRVYKAVRGGWRVEPVDPHAYAIWTPNPVWRKRGLYLKTWAQCIAYVIADQTRDIRDH